MAGSQLLSEMTFWREPLNFRSASVSVCVSLFKEKHMGRHKSRIRRIVKVLKLLDVVVVVVVVLRARTSKMACAPISKVADETRDPRDTGE